jgi:uncharacterized membrane protein YgdD (TMEM256/DUF423 family)
VIGLDRTFFSIGALMAGIAVAAGAYGAHGGSALDSDQVRWIAKAARYQMYHGLALICVSFALSHWQERATLFQISGWLFLLGIISFSGSLYLMTFTGIDLGYVTPIGGVAFIVGWVLMAVAGLMKR